MSGVSLTSITDYKSLVDNFEEPVVLFDDRLHVIYCNAQFVEVFGSAQFEFSQLVTLTEPMSATTLAQHIANAGYWSGHVGAPQQQAVSHPYRIRIMAMPKSKCLRFFGLIERADLAGATERSQESTVDELTGLPNRYAFFNAIKDRITLARGRAEFAVLYFDLDHFKDINELYGHYTGDEILRYCTVSIRKLLGSRDQLARLSGDEFAAIIECVGVDDAQRLCQRVLQMFEQPLTLSGRQYQFTASIGVAFYPEQGCTPEELLIHAEKAMFEAKRGGRARFQLFDQQHSQRVEHQQRLAEALRRELHADPEQFHAAYQPLYSLLSGECIGMEVLARWHSPEFGDVSPVDFIPLAESRGLVNVLSGRIYQAVINDLTAGKVLPLARKRRLLAVNVSAQQILSSHFEQLLMRFADDIAELGWRLEVELTESQLMSRTEALIEKLRRWRQMGIRIAIDDFGTGYSCLAYLHMLPVDKLKIDRQFLQARTASRSEDQIMYAILSMANALKIDVLAEGVETSDQFRRLIELGCSEAQGFGLARPQPWSPLLVNELWAMY